MVNDNRYMKLSQVKSITEILISSRNFEIASLKEFLSGEIIIMTDSYIFNNFEFNKLAYSDTENPNLDGKKVLVVKVKIIDHTDNDTEKVKYTFFDLGKTYRSGVNP